MRTITKGREPASLIKHRAGGHCDYDNYAAKDELREALVREQRGLILNSRDSASSEERGRQMSAKTATLTVVQQRTLTTFGYPNVVSCMSSGDYVAEGCGEGSHSHVWQVSSETREPRIAVAKFWRADCLDYKSAQERTLRRAARLGLGSSPRLIGSSAACTLMTLCPGITLNSFAKRVANLPSSFTVEGIEHLLVAFVRAISDFNIAGLYNEDLHDDNVLVDYPHSEVWIIDPRPTRDPGSADSGHRIVRVLSRCISVVAAAQAAQPVAEDSAMWRMRYHPQEYTSWGATPYLPRGRVPNLK